MNKYQEAYDLISGESIFNAIALSDERYEDNMKALDILRGLVDKATPKKPLLRKDGYDEGSEICDTWDCPNCGETFVIEDDTDKCIYCPNCGQKIDWGEE